jgi:hypothetical protein
VCGFSAVSSGIPKLLECQDASHNTTKTPSRQMHQQTHDKTAPLTVSSDQLMHPNICCAKRIVSPLERRRRSVHCAGDKSRAIFAASRNSSIDSMIKNEKTLRIISPRLSLHFSLTIMLHLLLELS